MRVLYVDDDRVNSLLFCEVAHLAEGVEVAVAGSATEALELVGSQAPDLLVIDLHLPDGDGLSLLPQLRMRAGPVPAFLCTADDASLVEARARAAGFDDCWVKPLDVPRVLDVLRRAEPCSSRSG